MILSEKDVINLLKNTKDIISGNILFFLIYCLDFIIITSPKTIFKIRDLKNLCYALKPFYDCLYSLWGIIILFLVATIWTVVGKSLKGFPLYLFLVYYLLYGWTFCLNIFILSGSKKSIVNEWTEYFVAALGILFFVFSILNIYKDYMKMQNS